MVRSLVLIRCSNGQSGWSLTSEANQGGRGNRDRRDPQAEIGKAAGCYDGSRRQKPAVAPPLAASVSQKGKKKESREQEPDSSVLKRQLQDFVVCLRGRS